MAEVKTPPLKWHGGKNYLAKWIRSLAPEGRYLHRVHPYGGGLGEFWNWPCEGISEVVNDIDRRLSNLWIVLQRSECFAEFCRLVEATPFSWDEFARASDRSCGLGPTVVDAAKAAEFFVLVRQSRQGLMKDFATLSRTRTRRGMNEQVSSWLSAVEGLPEVHTRLKRVVITSMDALDLIRQQDGPKTFFYCDPPYLHETRTAKTAYTHEMTPEQHEQLLALLANVDGFFALSGYHSAMYDDWARDLGFVFHEKQIDNKASGKATKETKTECLWVNYEQAKHRSSGRRAHEAGKFFAEKPALTPQKTTPQEGRRRS